MPVFIYIKYFFLKPKALVVFFNFFPFLFFPFIFPPFACNNHFLFAHFSNRFHLPFIFYFSFWNYFSLYVFNTIKLFFSTRKCLFAHKEDSFIYTEHKINTFSIHQLLFFLYAFICLLFNPRTRKKRRKEHILLYELNVDKFSVRPRRDCKNWRIRLFGISGVGLSTVEQPFQFIIKHVMKKKIWGRLWLE